MSTYTDFYEYKEAVRSSYSNDWDSVFSYAGINPSKKTLGAYVYYDGSDICHKENTPSVQEFPDSLYCHKCDSSLDIFALCEEATGKEFITILNELAELKGITYEPPKQENQRNNNYESKVKWSYKDSDVQIIYGIFMQLTHHLMFSSQSGEKCREYAKSRGLDVDYLKNLTFKLSLKNEIHAIGYLPFGKSVSNEIKQHMFNQIKNIPNTKIKTFKDFEEALQASKLVNNKGNFKLMGRLICVIVLQNKVVNVYGRKIDDDNDYPKHLYLELENHGFYNFDNARRSEYAVFSECIIDALSLMQYGINAISTFGVGGWKKDVCLSLLNRSKIKLLYFMYDKDKIQKIEKLDDYRHHNTGMVKHLGPAGMNSAIKVGKEIANNSAIKIRITDIPYDTSKGFKDKNDVNNMVSKLVHIQKPSEEIKKYLQGLIRDSKDFDTAYLMLKLEIMEENADYYSELDKIETCVDVLSEMHVLNSHHVIQMVSDMYKISMPLLLTHILMKK